MANATAPTDLTSYVGRRRERAELRRLLGPARLVTLTGPGGVGKSRLAVRAMRDAASAFPDGVVFVELAQVRDGALVPDLVADRLGLHDRSDLSVIIDHLRDRTILVVLDNCEHLVEDCAGFAAEVLARCPRTVLLATSRQSLAVYGEQVLPIAPLPVDDAVALFRERAAAVWPRSEYDPAVLAELCRCLDGLPLAIELAAARIRSLSPAQIVDRLSGRLGLLTSGSRSAPERQQTLRATIDWSYDLCPPAERDVWARMSVFAGSFDLAAAEHVGGGAVLEQIDGLLDRSVLIRSEHDGVVRYQMLETLREYGQERLEQAGDRDRVARLHRDWFDRLTATADAEWLSDRQLDWIGRLNRDHANLRAALAWSLTQPDGVALRMACRLPEYWTLRGLAGEARTRLDRSLAATPADHPVRAYVLRTCALYSVWLGDVERATDLLAEADGLADAIGNELLTASIQHVRAFATMLTRRPGAVGLAAGTCAVFRARGIVRGELHPLFIHGICVAYRNHDLAAARRSLRRMYELATDAGDTFYRAMSLFGRAIVEVEFGDAEAAAEAAGEALRLDRRAGDDHGRAYRIDTLACVADRQGDHVRAATLFGVAATSWDRIGTAPDFVMSAPHREHIGHTRKALGNAAFDKAFAAGRELPDEEATRYALGERSAAAPRLTERESEIATLIAEGLTNRDIAARLVIAQRTAETHVRHILTKLDFNNRAQIAAWVTARSRREP